MEGPLGPIGDVARGKVFDDKVALDSRYQYNGSKEQGAQWREKTRGYLISKSPALFKLLPWAESQDHTEITGSRICAVVGARLDHNELELLNIALWGFLSTCTSSTAETIFNSAEKLNGLEAWRKLCRHIDWGAGIYLEDCRAKVRQITMKPIRRLEDIAMGVIEFEKSTSDTRKLEEQYHRRLT